MTDRDELLPGVQHTGQYPADILGTLPRADLRHLQCPLTPDPECIAYDDGLCCHSSSPTECAHGPEGTCLAHESLSGDWQLGTLEPARRDNDFLPAVVCEHVAHEPYRKALADWVANGYAWPDKQHWTSANSEAYGWALEAVEQTNLRVLWAHHYNDFCPAWPYNEGHAEQKAAARAKGQAERKAAERG